MAICSVFTYCTKDDKPDDKKNNTSYQLGYFGTDDFSKVPVSTNFNVGGGNLPAKADIISKFPPIGDQGSYGTCVAWAVGYNMKTCIAGIKNNLSQSQLADASNQYSPKFLFTAVADDKKGANCSGTNFDDALSVVQQEGIATMQTVPYDQLGDCARSNLQSSWSQEAAKFKIKSWRRIDATVQAVKENIANNIPVVFGARLADNFMSWRGDGVISNVTSYDNVGQHAYHAMIIAGYDDSKGANGAFRIVNSWGNQWGDAGYIWVDYNFFFQNFVMSAGDAKALYVAEDAAGKTDPPNPDPNPTQTGVDLAPWVFNDYSTYETSGSLNERQVEFNLYNIGNQAAKSSDDWAYYYIYYNAYDANDYGVIFYDQFNTSVAANSYDCPTDNNCIINFDIPAGGDMAQVVFQDQSLVRTYNMPQITGEYYIVMLADASEKFKENDEQNNVFYTTVEPKYFDGGYSELRPSNNNANYFKFTNTLQSSKDNLQKSVYNTAVTAKHRNAYSPEEIKAFVKHEYETGRLQAKAANIPQKRYALNSK
jgi:hypothetical protein